MTPALKGFVYKPSPRPGAALGEGWGKEPALPLTPTPPAGGMVTSGLAIYDTMQYILNPICTWCVGQAASMGSLLLAAGTPGMRHSLPNSRIMIHQPSGGARGQATDIAIQAEEIMKLKKQLYGIYAKHTKQSLQVIESAMERDRYMSPMEAQEFGILDKVLVHPPQDEESRGSQAPDAGAAALPTPRC
uniref:ATP-dependent Clp protease proteolytic subunit n=1 Tax=Ursus maritimus TaxID=29073 RepID=A0A452U2Y2_URSMA